MTRGSSKHGSRLKPAEAQRIAQVTHEAVRAWQAANGQPPAPTWSRAPEWMKTSTLQAVYSSTGKDQPTPAARHRQWMNEKKAAGWKLGRKKDGRLKTHPLMVPYSQLPEVERRKDALVSAVIASLTGRLR